MGEDSTAIMRVATVNLQRDRDPLERLLGHGRSMRSDMYKADSIISDIERSVFIRKCLLYACIFTLTLLNVILLIRKLLF